MTHHAGIWIDHRKAVLVELTAEGETVRTIESHVEKHGERTGDSPLKDSYEARQVPADDSRQRALTGDLHRYYDAVIAVLPSHTTLLVFGPGEPVELLPLETDDKMTDNQIVAKVRAKFGVSAPRR